MVATSRNTSRYGLFFDLNPNGNALTNILSIIDNGKVGINTDNPSEELDVIGNIKVNKPLEMDHSLLIYPYQLQQKPFHLGMKWPIL